MDITAVSNPPNNFPAIIPTSGGGGGGGSIDVDGLATEDTAAAINAKMDTLATKLDTLHADNEAGVSTLPITAPTFFNGPAGLDLIPITVSNGAPYTLAADPTLRWGVFKIMGKYEGEGVLTIEGGSEDYVVELSEGWESTVYDGLPLQQTNANQALTISASGTLTFGGSIVVAKG